LKGGKKKAGVLGLRNADNKNTRAAEISTEAKRGYGE